MIKHLLKVKLTLGTFMGIFRRDFVSITDLL
jgi:hypothetical protein